MSVGFGAAGRTEQIEKLVNTAGVAAEKLDYEIEAGEYGMLIKLCPMGDLEITWREDEEVPGQWLVESECTTSQAGAGFHKAALELIEALGIDQLKVWDETDYYSHRDFERVKREHFYPWLDSLLHLGRKLLSERDSGQLMLCWDRELYHPEDVARTVVTPLGRYSLEGLSRILEEEGMEATAERFCVWGNEERDAVFYRNRALYQLWVDCCYVSSDFSEVSREINESILEDLERAYQMDPELLVPYEAYLEVCALHGRKPVIPEDAAKLSYEFPIGYRKGLIVESLERLRLTLPGTYLYELEETEDGGNIHLWLDEASDGPEWRVSIYYAASGEAQFMGEMKGVKDFAQQEIPNGCMRFGWRRFGTKDDGCYIMQCEVISGSSLYLITAAYLEPEERAGIVELLNRISVVPEEREES